MSDVNFASAEIELMVHATEDGEKILRAIKNVLLIDPEEFSAESIEGHFGNEIIKLKAILSSKRATEFAHKVISMLSEVDRLEMYDNFELYTDEKNSIYLRISKQKIFEPKIVLEQSDSLKIKLKTVKRFKPKNAMENYRNLLKGDNN